MRIRAKKDRDFLIGIGVLVHHTHVDIYFNFGFWYVILIFYKREKANK